MSFDSLPPQPPIFPAEAEAYSQRALALSRAAAAECRTEFDIPYGADERQVIDIYRPLKSSTDGLPVLVFLHGGAWTNGYKEWMGLLAPSITTFPAIFVSASCRLAPVHRFPTPLDDFIRILQWVNSDISTHGGDPQRLYVGGHSSGGHLAALATLRTDALRAAGLSPTAITACFPVSARFNMVFEKPAPGSTEYRHQSMLFEAGQDAKPASPLHQIGSCQTPFLLAYGERDIPAIIENNEQMVTALSHTGTAVERLVLADHDHFDMAINIREPQGPWMQRVRAWMTRPDKAHLISAIKPEALKGSP